MKINYLIAGMLAVPVLGVFAKLCWPLAHGSKSTRPIAGQNEPARGDELAALTREVQQLRGQMGNLATGQAALSVRVQSAAPGGAPSREPAPEPQPPEAVESDEVIKERKTQAALRKIQTMESRFSSEPVDQHWAKGAANDLRDKINLTDAVVRDVQCATTLCRFTLSATSGDQTMQAVDAALKQRPWEGEAFFYFDQNDPGKANVYLARAGNPLPKLE